MKININGKAFTPQGAVISERIPVSEHIWIRFLYGDDGRWELNIGIDEKAGVKEIEGNWRKILAERDRLIRFQGHDIPDIFREAIAALTMDTYIDSIKFVRTDTGSIPQVTTSIPTYQDLTLDINFDALVFAVRASKLDESPGTAEIGRLYLEGLLRAFDWKDKEIKAEIRKAIYEVSCGRCPWDIKDEPVIKDVGKSQLREKVRYLRGREQEIGKEIQPPADLESLYQTRRQFFKWGDWRVAIELLSRTYPDTYQMYEHRLKVRLIELVLSKGKYS